MGSDTDDDGISMSGSSNVIYNNEIQGYFVGIRLYGDNNRIHGNNVKNNLHGIWLGWGSKNTQLYHNNLVNNSENARDFSGVSQWYNETLRQGNYYSDYTGSDVDGNGIGDTPYNITGGAKDLYPLMKTFVRVDNFPTISNVKIIPTKLPSKGYVHITADISDDIGLRGCLESLFTI